MSLNTDLLAIKDAWDTETGNGRDMPLAQSLSDAYVAANTGYYDGFSDMDLPSLVGALETFRAAGMENDEWSVQVWIWHKFEPQNIGGLYQPQIRIVNGE